MARDNVRSRAVDAPILSAAATYTGRLSSANAGQPPYHALRSSLVFHCLVNCGAHGYYAAAVGKYKIGTILFHVADSRSSQPSNFLVNMKSKDPDSSLGPLPEHVESVRKGLLNFTCSLPITSKDGFDDDVEEFKHYSSLNGREADSDLSASPPDTQGSSSVWWHFTRRETRGQKNRATSLNEYVDQCRSIASHAKRIDRGMEADWAHFYRTNIFVRYHDSVAWTHSKLPQNASAMGELSGESSDLFDQWRL